MKTDEIILARNKDSTPMLKMYHSTAVTGKRVYIEHHHTQLEISAVLSGSCEWQVRRRPYLCGAGDIMLLGSDEEHYITYIGEEEPFRLLNLQVEPRFIWAPGEDSFDSRYLHIFLNHDSSFNNLLPSTNATAKRVFALLSEMYEEGMNRETGYPLIVKAELMLILGLLGREYSGFIAGAAAETGASRARIDEAMSYINDHLCDELSLDEDFIRSLDRIFIVACGSSYHVGMVGKYNLERLLRKPVDVQLASEFRYADPLVGPNSLVIVISQSGETLDTMAALREARRLGAKILSIVNVVGSSIARESDDVLYTWAGPEIAVATTKAYSTQLVLLDMLGVYFAKVCGSIGDAEYEEIVEELLALPVKMEAVLEDIDEIKYLASRYFNHNSIFFIGRNLDYALGLEGSLKLKEISYIHSEAYASGELKHGTISLIEDGTLVVALGTYKPLFEKTLSNIIEVKARGADIVALTAESKAADMRKTAENVLSVPDTHVILQPSLGVIPLQLFAYYVALHKGCDIDKPRNLAKSVTVE